MPAAEPEPEWLSPSEAARFLGISQQWLRDLAESGRIAFEATPLGRIYSRAVLEEVRQARAAR